MRAPRAEEVLAAAWPARSRPQRTANPSRTLRASSTLRAGAPVRAFGSIANPFRYMQERRLGLLEQQAIDAADNAAMQVEYYRELMAAGHPKLVVDRVESGKFAMDAQVVQLYIQALAQAGQSDRIITKLVQLSNRHGGVIPDNNDKLPLNEIVQAALGPKGAGAKIISESAGGAGVGAKSSPVHVVIEEQKGSTVWRMVRSISVALIYGFVVLTVVGISMDNSGLLKTGSQQTEVEPSKGRLVTFADVQGCEEAKEELMETVYFLKHPEKFRELGGRMPKGVLLTGPPGTGKTLLARAVAGEAGVPFFFMSGSEFDEMYVGVGARRVRELFAAARKKSPSIVFIDELDAIGSRRNPKDQAYMKQTLNQLLVELDGFSQTEGVIVMGATNFPELLDKALVRPGRFDRHVAVPLPDVRGRLAILKLHAKSVQLAANLDLSVIARGTPGFSGADLQNLVNQAAIQASRENATKIQLKHLEFAKDKILMGSERRSAIITEESKRCTAYHEGGHALVALYTPGAMPLHKATIMPRGHSLGMTVQLPEMDRNSFSKKEFFAQIDVCMGGRIAEEMIFGEENVTSGAQSDLIKATDVAKRMVTEYGMSDKVGPVAHSEDAMAQLSTPTKLLIEGEIKAFVEAGRDRATHILKSHRAELDRLAQALIEYETLTADEIQRAVKGQPIRR